MGGWLLDFIFHYIMLSAEVERLTVRVGRDTRLLEIRRVGMPRCVMGKTSPIHGSLG